MEAIVVGRRSRQVPDGSILNYLFDPPEVYEWRTAWCVFFSKQYLRHFSRGGVTPRRMMRRWCCWTVVSVVSQDGTVVEKEEGDFFY